LKTRTGTHGNSSYRARVKFSAIKARGRELGEMQFGTLTLLGELNQADKAVACGRRPCKTTVAITTRFTTGVARSPAIGPGMGRSVGGTPCDPPPKVLDVTEDQPLSIQLRFVHLSRKNYGERRQSQYAHHKRRFSKDSSSILSGEGFDERE
jgi:hypothetical protein